MSDVTLPGDLERLFADDDGAFYADEAAARAIAIVIKLFDDKHYSWPEWVDKFGTEIDAPGHYRNSPDDAKVTEAALGGDAKNIHRNYAELWLTACEKLLLKKGLVTQTELDEAFTALAAEENSGGGFAINERVVVRDIEPIGHAHLPLFVRGKTGVVERRLGDFAFPPPPDGATQPGERKTQQVYSVRFAARDLWGLDAARNDSVNISIWDSYLIPA